MPKKKIYSDSGFMGVDAIGALLLLLIMIPLLASLWQRGLDYLKQRGVAEHFMAVEKAARSYAKLNHASLMSQSTQNSGPSVSIATLKNSGALPDRYGDKNAWGQSYQINARKDDNGDLAMVIVTTSGRGHRSNDPKFANIMVPETAAMARAGFIPTGLVGSGGVIRGSYGAWEVSLSSLGLSGTPGHLGIVSTLSSDDLKHDFLYRIAVPGHPELNAMQTALDMTDHSINTVKDVQFVHDDILERSGFCASAEDEGRTFLDKYNGLYLCRDGRATLINDTGNSLMMQEAQVTGNAQLVDKPKCPEKTGTHPEIFVTPSIASVGELSPAIVSFQTWATEYSTDQWQIHMRILTEEDKWIYPEPNYGRILVMTTCARD